MKEQEKLSKYTDCKVNVDLINKIKPVLPDSFPCQSVNYLAFQKVSNIVNQYNPGQFWVRNVHSVSSDSFNQIELVPIGHNSYDKAIKYFFIQSQ